MQRYKVPQHKILKTILIFISVITIIGVGSYVVSTVMYVNSIYDQSNLISSASDSTKALLSRIAAKKKQPVYISLPSSTPFQARVEDYTQPSSLWALVNKTHPIPITYAPAGLVLPDVPERTDKSIEERSLRSDAAGPVKHMFDAATADGHSLMIASAYRSATLQKTYFNNYAAISGVAAANLYSAFPGQSEHQTGLAIDISSVSRNCYLDTCFMKTLDGIWLAANGYKYGFVLRYPEGKTDITGYNFEPWHYRYVGIDLATALYKSGLVMDQAWPYLQAADMTLRQNGAL
jgi:D-alanyl-D-alanine carboxypeptidase